MSLLFLGGNMVTARATEIGLLGMSPCTQTISLPKILRTPLQWYANQVARARHWETFEQWGGGYVTKAQKQNRCAQLRDDCMQHQEDYGAPRQGHKHKEAERHSAFGGLRDVPSRLLDEVRALLGVAVDAFDLHVLLLNLQPEGVSFEGGHTTTFEWNTCG